jgi:hypothetical protein
LIFVVGGIYYVIYLWNGKITYGYYESSWPRLNADAINSHLLHISVGTDIPKELGKEYFEIINSLTKNEAPSEIDAEHCAQKIVGLHEKLSQLVHYSHNPVAKGL